jgi:hypothetical protein
MKKTMIAALVLAAGASMASAQAITGFTGGSQFDSYYGGLFAGDVVGWGFDVVGGVDIIVTDLGVWNQDTQLGSEGLTSDHQVGIWDLSGNLLTSTVAGPGGTVVGDWTYASTANVTLTAGETYVIGALYNAGGVPDGDSYISSPSTVSLAPEIAFTYGVFPDAEDLGFVFPGQVSTNLGRFGPNFQYTLVPSPASVALLGLGGLVATRRRR